MLLAYYILFMSIVEIGSLALNWKKTKNTSVKPWNKEVVLGIDKPGRAKTGACDDVFFPESWSPSVGQEFKAILSRVTIKHFFIKSRYSWG